MLNDQKLPLNRILAFIGWIFIIAGMVVFRYITTQPPTFLTPYASTVQDIEEDNPDAACGPGCASLFLRVTITLPRKLVLHQSTPLIVTIVSHDSPIALTPEPYQTQLPTENVSVTNIFTPLEAQLSASSFDIDPQRQLAQEFNHFNLRTQELDFYWTITPKYKGRQTIVINIAALDQTVQQASIVEHILTHYSTRLEVADIANPPTGASFSNPFFNLGLGQITIGALIATLLGSCLNIPWIVELLQKRKETKEKKQQDQSVILTKPTNISTSDASARSKNPSPIPATKKRRQKNIK